MMDVIFWFLVVTVAFPCGITLMGLALAVLSSMMR